MCVTALAGLLSAWIWNASALRTVEGPVGNSHACVHFLLHVSERVSGDPRLSSGQDLAFSLPWPGFTHWSANDEILLSLKK